MRQCLIHQNTDGNCQRLRTDITGHVEDHRLEDHQNRQLLYHLLKQTDNSRYAHAKSQQDQQPRQSLFDTLPQRLLQIFLRSQTCQLRVILTHLIIYNFDDALGGDNTKHPILLIQQRDQTLRIIF